MEVERKAFRALSSSSKLWRSDKTRYLRMVLLPLFLFCRVALIAIPSLNKSWDIELASFLIHIELQDMNLVCLGVLLFYEYGMSAGNCFYWILNIRQRTQQNIFGKIVYQHCSQDMCALGTSMVSMIVAGWMFVFVRRIWTRHLCVLIQVLHLFPSSAVIMQTFFSGILLCAISPIRNGSILSKGDRPTYKQDIKSHILSNILLMLYSILNLVVAIWSQESYGYALPISVCAVVECCCRLFFVRLLWSKLNYRTCRVPMPEYDRLLLKTCMICFSTPYGPSPKQEMENAIVLETV